MKPLVCTLRNSGRKSSIFSAKTQVFQQNFFFLEKNLVMLKILIIFTEIF